VWWNTPVIPVLRKLRQEDCEFQASLGYIVKTLLKNENSIYRVGGVAQVVEPLPGYHEALSSNPSTVKKKKPTLF
jgi:hypothetical protein